MRSISCFSHAAVASACLLVAGSSFATNYPVSNVNDSGAGSLRDAFSHAGDNDTISFNSGVTGTIFLTSGPLETGVQNMRVIGPGPKVLSISGSHSSTVFLIGDEGAVTISGLEITDGYAAGAENTGSNSYAIDGGGGGVVNFGTLTLENCLITLNQAIGGQGAFYMGVSGGSGYGGGIYNLGNLSLVNCEVSLNSAFGGTGSSSYTDPTGGSGGNGFGGGIYSPAGSLSITGCTIDSNLAEGGDGGTGASGSGAPGPAGGAGISDYPAVDPGGTSMQLVNSTVAFNAVSSGPLNPGDDFPNDFGGGVFIFQTPVGITNCTVSQNSCTGGSVSGGGLDFGPVAASLANTIVSGNTVSSSASDAAGPDVSGTVSSQGFNLIGQLDGASSGWQDNDLFGEDPQLGPLQNNFGPTPTMSLMSGSPAIDQGANFGLETDQRGFPRPYVFQTTHKPAGGNGTDIGAFELWPDHPTLAINPQRSDMAPIPPGIARLLWSETSVPTPTPGKTQPVFALQPAWGNLPTSSEAWSAWSSDASRIIVRRFGDHYVGRDLIPAVPISGYYRLTDDPAITNTWADPAVTLPATNISTFGATLQGSDTPIVPDAVYWFVWGPTTSYGATNSPMPLTTSTNLTNFSLAIVGLSPSTVYHFQAFVMDDDGTMPGGDQAFTTADPIPVCITYAASSITATSAQLNGSVDPGGPGAVNAYFEYGLDTNQQDLTATTTFFPTGNYFHNYSFNATGLSPNNTYYYHAVAFNNSHTGYGAWTNFTTPALPLPPTLVSPGASSPTGPYVNTLTPTFSWNANGAASYALYINLFPSGTLAYSTTGLTGSPVAPITLGAGTTFSWHMTASDSFGNQSGPSQTNYFQTPAPPTAVTETVSNIGPYSATFIGYVNPNGLPTSVQFQYDKGTGTNFGLVIPANLDPSVGTTPQFYNQTTTVLSPGSTYHFWFVASNSLGVSYGSPPITFTTTE